MLHVDPGEVVSGPACGCCSRPGLSAFGFVHRGSQSIAFYYAWLDPHEDRHAISLAISLGDWAPAGEPADRRAAALRFSSAEGEVSGEFIDPSSSPFRDRDILGSFLAESEVRESELVSEFLAVAEAIVLEDPEVNSHLMS